MAQVGLKPWPFTSQESTLPTEPAGCVNWLHSPLFTLITGNALQKISKYILMKNSKKCVLTFLKLSRKI